MEKRHGAFIVKKEGVDLKGEDVQDSCRGQISRYKVPKHIAFVDSYPMTASGKIQKHKLQEMSVDLFPGEDRQRLGDTIDAIVGTGNPAFIPWAMGKWLRSRGGILATYLAKASTDHMFLCESSTRPVFWPTPNHFKLARRYGIRILAGSDPLHFPSEVNRAGRFGFSLPEMVSDQNTVQDLKRYLRDRNAY